MILVYKTSVNTSLEAEKIKPYLDEILLNAKWNFNLADCDRILRIDAPAYISEKVIETMQRQGFTCVELE